jgi:hypothetical protein
VVCVAVAAMVEIVDRVRLSTLDTKNARLSYPSSGASVVHRCTECDRDGIGVGECVLLHGLDLVDMVVDASPFPGGSRRFGRTSVCRHSHAQSTYNSSFCKLRSASYASITWPLNYTSSLLHVHQGHPLNMALSRPSTDTA